MAEECVDCAPGSVSQAPSVPPPPAAAVPQPAATEQIIETPSLTTPHILLEFCDRCRWAPRATWTQTELLLTFPPPLIRSITLQPLVSPETGGRFRVWINMGGNGQWQLVWDRKTEGGFPELKVLKQRIRNHVQPEMNLGHSDVKK